MIRILLSFILLLFYTNSYTQNQEAFDKIYTKTFLETSNKDLKYAIKVSDSLYKVSQSPLYKSRSLMLSATLYKQSGDIKKSVEYGLKSLNTIQGTRNYEQETKIYGFLASQTRMLKFTAQADEYLEKAIVTIEKIKDTDKANNLMALIFQEKAYQQIEQKNFTKSIEYLTDSQKYFDLVKDGKVYYTISNEHLLGNSYYELNDLKNSELHYKRALQLSEKEPKTFLTGLIYNGLALIAIKKKEPENAKRFIDLSEKIYEKSQFLDLKNEIYATSKKYYELTDDIDNLVEVQKKKDSVGDQISSKYNEYVIESYNTLQQNVKKGQAEISKKNIFLIFCVIIIVIGALIFYLSKLRQKAKLQKFKNIIAGLDEKINARILNENEISTNEIIEDPVTEPTSLIEDSTVMISKKTEEKIKEKLRKFENSFSFTQKNMSLPTLATYCGTNIKYLSYIIKNERNNDFAGYINYLRINYIIYKLRNDKDYRKYKMAVLADEAGYSSPNKFATIFKNITSFPPSVFIKYLEDEIKE